MKNTKRGGRPPKFDEDRTPITVTLPRRILQKIAQVDEDRAKGIVKCVENLFQSQDDSTQIEIVNISDDTGLIVVGPSKSLKKIPWLTLVEITPMRFLLSVPSGTLIETLEIAIMDLIDDLTPEDTHEMALLLELRQKLRQHRRKDSLSKGEILFVNTATSFLMSLVIEDADIFGWPLGFLFC